MHHNFTPAVIFLFLGLIILSGLSFTTKKHPFYVSVIDLKYIPAQKSIQISARMFTNDLEDALRKLNNQSIDLLNPPMKAKNDSLLYHYIKDRLKISMNSKKLIPAYVGYEREEESVWVYLEIKNSSVPKKLTIESSLLYDFITQQINIVHIEVMGTKRSHKLINPESKTEFIF